MTILNYYALSELRQFSPNSYRRVIPELIRSNNFIEVGIQMRANNDKELSIVIVAMQVLIKTIA